MTAAEDAANAADNDRMEACCHSPVTYGTCDSPVWCSKCGAEFALVLKPRLAKVIPLVDDEENDS